MHMNNHILYDQIWKLIRKIQLAFGMRTVSDYICYVEMYNLEQYFLKLHLKAHED